MTVGGVELRGQRLLRPRGAAARVAAAAAAWSCCEGGCTARVAEAVVGESLCTQSPTRRAATAVELATPRGRDGPRRSHTRPQSLSPPPNSTSPSSSSSTGELDRFHGEDRAPGGGRRGRP
ncbi:Os12g0188802 [Oryza sativa Japonica Group]|uniref:Os12g0188802 protein n=1 Tax=Oryza sativa subsp. japonica TaxID=39947 RepID=A0A0P0Y7U0_ORYSJ|nr:Os12g0188802 [Oryza sativa Japonica Group]